MERTYARWHAIDVEKFSWTVGRCAKRFSASASLVNAPHRTSTFTISDLFSSSFFSKSTPISSASASASPDSSPWVVFTATERAYQPLPSHTLELLLRGWRPLPSKSSTKSASLQRRVLLRLRSASFSEIRMVSHKSRLLLVHITESMRYLTVAVMLTVFLGNKILRILKSNGTLSQHNQHQGTWPYDVFNTKSKYCLHLVFDWRSEISNEQYCPCPSIDWLDIRRPRPRDPWGPLHADQEGKHFRYSDARNLLISYSTGRRCSQASWAQPKG